jgi:hypothetical protein
MCRNHRVLLAALLAALPLAAPAATICVNPGGTLGCLSSIAAAIASAAPVGDTINVAAGTYLESGLVIGKSVDIVGAGVDVTIVDGAVNGVNGPQIFRYPSGFPATSTLSNMTIRGGARGIDVGGGNTVTVDHARVTANGPATGAGIFNGASRLYVKASLIDGNSATDAGSIAGCDWGGASGGGIASLCGGGNNTITDSAIINNTAGRWGGGLIINDGTSVIENTTISGNQANFPDPTLRGGGLFVGGAFPDILIRFSTIANNAGGGLWADAKLKLYASVLQGNTGGDCSSPGFQPASLGYNVVSDASCPFAQVGDAVSIDAQLQPLAMNGGPTATHAIPRTSPAIDRVPAEECTVFDDQRGVVRPQHRACDSGAFEYVYSVQDLQAILVAQLVSPVPPGLVNQITKVLPIALAINPGMACNILANFRWNISQLQAHRQLPSGQAMSIIISTEDLAHAVGC